MTGYPAQHVLAHYVTTARVSGKKDVADIKRVFLSETFLILKTIQQDIINVHTY